MNSDQSRMLLHRFAGATVRRVVDRSHSLVAEHAHDWPILSLFVMGSYGNRSDIGDGHFDGPSAVLYRRGAPHQNRSGPEGFEQIEIEFDPAWLGKPGLSGAPVSRWIGGEAGRSARELALACAAGVSETGLQQHLLRMFRSSERGEPQRPDWIDKIDHALRSETGPSAKELGVLAQRHPFWLGAAYAKAKGESLQRTVARLRVEKASRLLRETADSGAAIAADAGFFDQSHMIRTFKRILGRTPSAVRADLLRKSEPLL